MATQKTELSARELLESVYEALCVGGKKIKFSSKVLAEIAKDSDWHRTRIGYSGYESATIIQAGEKKWALSFGVACGAYPAHPYNCDIACLLLADDGKRGKELAAEIQRQLEVSAYFRSSLIIAMADGRLASARDSRYGQVLFERITAITPEYVARYREIDDDLIGLDLSPVVKSPTYYKPELVEVLVQMIREFLAE